MNTNNKNSHNCPFCKKTNERIYFTFKNRDKEISYELVKCLNCRLYFSNNIQNNENILSLKKIENREVFFNNKNNVIRANFIKAFLNEGLILQVDAGKGELLQLLKSDKIRILGIEQDSSVFNENDIYVDENYQDTFQDFFHYENEFDAILFINYLNYSNNPEKDLNKALKLLKEDGLLIIEEKIYPSKLGDIFKENYSNYNLFEQKYFYNPSVLKRIFRQKGYYQKSYLKIYKTSNFSFIKSFNSFMKNKLKLKFFILRLPFLILAFLFTPFLNIYFSYSNYKKYGVYGDTYLAAFSKSKKR